MFKFIAIVVCGLIAVASAKPGILAPLAYSSPLVAAAAPLPYVAAHSSQVVARNHHTLAAYVAPAAVPAIAPAPLAYTSPLGSPLGSPYLGAYSAGLRLASPYAAYSPYSPYSAYSPYSPYFGAQGPVVL